jgi:hypothetical protein
MTDTSFSCIDLPAAADQHAVAGFHAHCDIRLEQDRTVEDRHLLFRSETLDDGCPVLRVLDLDTRQGFSLTDDSFPHSIAALGPTVLRVGSSVIVAFPSGERLPDEMPETRYTRGTRSDRRLVAVRSGTSPVVVAPLESSLAPRSITDVRLLHRPITIHDLSQQSPARSIARGYELTLESPTGKMTLRLSKDDLDHGVLVGRDPRRCVAELHRILHLHVSRIHLLLLRQRDEIVAHDVASMNGTWVDRRRVRTATLDDDGTEIFLGTTPVIRLSWRADRS